MNPQQFIAVAADAINRCKRLALVAGIAYHKLGERHVHALESFESEALTGYLRNLRPDAQSRSTRRSCARRTRSARSPMRSRRTTA